MSVHRLTRNRHTRRAYDALKRRGVTATRLVEYGRSLPVEGTDDAPVDVETCSADAAAERYDLDFSVPFAPRKGERAVVALVGGEAVGRVLVCPAGNPYVGALETEVGIEGAYVRKVFVAPAHRGRGVATALLGEACALADDIGAERVNALVAADNQPSRALFASQGFQARREHTYLRAGPWRHRRVEEI